MLPLVVLPSQRKRVLAPDKVLLQQQTGIDDSLPELDRTATSVAYVEGRAKLHRGKIIIKHCI